ncbi:MAG TPA: hypothetical protein VMD59_02280, partial [Acidimicrobiales bacterium]|nr:hypothetical protein [Acidimicrobiales bacterium]
MNKNDLDRLLARLLDLDGSDLHVKVGSPPRVRVNGDLIRLQDEPVIHAPDVETLARAIMQERSWRDFEAHFEADFAYSVPQLGRFRVNAFRQRGSVGMVFRRVHAVTRSIE